MKMKNYWAPTPKKWRKLGDALLGTFGSVSIPTALSGHTWIASACWILAMAGKFLTNFFTEDETAGSK